MLSENVSSSESLPPQSSIGEATSLSQFFIFVSSLSFTFTSNVVRRCYFVWGFQSLFIIVYRYLESRLHRNTSTLYLCKGWVKYPVFALIEQYFNIIISIVPISCAQNMLSSPHNSNKNSNWQNYFQSSSPGRWI